MRVLGYFLGILVLFSPVFSMPWWMNNTNSDRQSVHGKNNSSMHRGSSFRGNNMNMGRNNRYAFQRNNREMGNNRFHRQMRGNNRMGHMGNSGAFQTSLFVTHQLCAKCHDNLRDSSGQDVSIPKDWCSTMMANAGLDPLWQAKVHSEIIRNPSFKETIEKKCSTCHMPMAKTQAEFDGKKIQIFDNGFLNPKNPYHKLAKEGVSCTLCHQIQPNSSFSGGYVIDKNTKNLIEKYLDHLKILSRDLCKECPDIFLFTLPI